MWQTTTVGITATKPAAATPAPVFSLNVTVAAASQNTGRVMVTTTAETTVTRHMPTAPTRGRNNTAIALLFVSFCLYSCQLYLSQPLITSRIVFHCVYMLLFAVVKRLSRWRRGSPSSLLHFLCSACLCLSSGFHISFTANPLCCYVQDVIMFCG